MKTILYNPIFINPQAYYVFPRLTRYLQPDNESTAEPANYIGTIEVKVIAYGDTTLKRTYTNTDSIDLSEFKNTWIRISLFTKVGSCVLGEWKIGNMESDLPYIDPEVLASLKAVVIVGNKTNNDSDRAIVKNLVDASNPFVISNASYNLNSGYGKYNITFQHFPYRENIISINDNKVVFDKGGQLLLPYPSMDRDIPSFKVKVSGLSGTYHFRYYYRDSNGAQDSINMAKDGIYELPICYNVQSSSDGTNCGFANNGSDIVTIEQVPEFQGAFVTDGVNDVITSTKTALEMLGETNEITVVSMIHQITLNGRYNIGLTNYIRSGVTGNSGPYLRSLVTDSGKTGIYGYTAYNLNKNIDKNSAVINNILGDKNDYYLDTNNDYILDDSLFSVQNFVHRDGSISDESSSVAWYWTIIANKVLTTDQINQVIAYFNLDRTLKPDILCDVKKQGITNENHAEFGDKLIDFSGNGRDIQLNNIAWKGDSGIGKYEVDFLDSSIWNSSNSTITSSKIDCKNAISHIMLLYYSVGSKEYPDIPSFKVIKTGADIDYSYIDETGSPKSVRIVDGVNVLPASHNTLYSGSGRFCGFGNPGMGNSVTITQIPSHAGALCLDGVNDFGKVTGMPIYKDYIFIADRQIITNDDSGGIVASKSESSTDVAKQGAFIFEYLSTNAISTWSYYKNNSLVANSDSNRNISYQSKYSYNGKALEIGEGKDSDKLWIGTIRDNDERFANIAIYSLMSFPYSMSEFLIERQLKKHKLGTLYPDMVEFRPVIKANANYNIFYTALLPLTGIVWEKINIGDYIPVGRRVAIQLSFDNEASELVSAISSQLGNISITKNSNNKGYTIFGDILKNKSPQKINITIDEYIRYEDIVQPYPVLLRFNDENGNEVSWGGKFRVGSTITRIGSAADSNLLPNIYNIFGLLLNDNQVTSSKVIVEKTMVFKAKSAYIFDNNEPNCILSPRLLRIPNSSYKILGHIPDISGHRNHGKINNSAYAGMSGANGYTEQTFSNWRYNTTEKRAEFTISNDVKLNIAKVIMARGAILYTLISDYTTTNSIQRYKVTGVDENHPIVFGNDAPFDALLTVTTDGEYEVDWKTYGKNPCIFTTWTGDCNITIEQIGEYEGAYCLDGVDDFVTIPTATGGKQVFMKVNSRKSDCYLYDQRNNWTQYLGIVSTKDFIAYNYSNQRGKTYIDGILNENITANDLISITHNITVTNNRDDVEQYFPCIGTSFAKNSFAQMALYDFMLFDNISTDDKIKELNEYVGIEGNTE